MKKWLFSLLISLVLGTAMGQGLGFTSHAVPGLADTLIKGSNISYGVTVKSTGMLPVPGNFTVYIGVSDSALTSIDLVDSVVVNSNSFQPGDSIQVPITHNVDPLKFLDGGNTVVIWPAAPGVLTTDTIIRDVYVLNFESVDENELVHIRLYPNPATDFISIQSTEKVEKVRIYDLQGKQIFSYSGSWVPVSELENGYYVVEAETALNKTLRRKIMIQR